jgi:hypothetical protein
MVPARRADGEFSVDRLTRAVSGSWKTVQGELPGMVTEVVQTGYDDVKLNGYCDGVRTGAA